MPAQGSAEPPPPPPDGSKPTAAKSAVARPPPPPEHHKDHAAKSSTPLVHVPHVPKSGTGGTDDPQALPMRHEATAKAPPRPVAQAKVHASATERYYDAHTKGEKGYTITDANGYDNYTFGKNVNGYLYPSSVHKMTPVKVRDMIAEIIRFSKDPEWASTLYSIGNEGGKKFVRYMAYAYNTTVATIFEIRCWVGLPPPRLKETYSFEWGKDEGHTRCVRPSHGAI